MLPRRSAALTCFCQGSCHLVLGGVDVAGRPAALRSQRTQRLNQHLWDRGVSRAGTAQHSTAQPSPAQHSTACCSGQPGMEQGAAPANAAQGKCRQNFCERVSGMWRGLQQFPKGGQWGKAGLSHPGCPNKKPLTAVCAVMCVQPTILAPAKGFSP